ncbi:MAG TPA: benenodin family lasso peptide [Parvularculaceae bacterium]|nr:benenodin family lasso peptide [Parvularculaceae bacterium]HRX39121.1 benenodin family lasso peptide [Parvularculaceae bacterium]
MKKPEDHIESVAEHDDGIADLGAASELTQGAPGLPEEFENRIPQVGISD